jgi:hypothetical protein
MENWRIWTARIRPGAPDLPGCGKGAPERIHGPLECYATEVAGTEFIFRTGWECFRAVDAFS